MIRHQKAPFSPFGSVVLAALILGLPFVHLHPRITHDDPLGLHAHNAVIHTVFSTEDTAGSVSPADGHDSEASVELFRAAIDLNLFTKRSPTEFSGHALTAARKAPDLSPIAIYSTLTTKHSLLLLVSRTGFPRFVRGPPSDLYS